MGGGAILAVVEKIGCPCHAGHGDEGSSTVDNLLEVGVADGVIGLGIEHKAGFVLVVVELDLPVGLGGGPLVGSDDLIDVPLVVVLDAMAVRPVLQRIAGAAPLVIGRGLCPDMETGANGPRGYL